MNDTEGLAAGYSESVNGKNKWSFEALKSNKVSCEYEIRSKPPCDSSKPCPIGKSLLYQNKIFYHYLLKSYLILHYI